MRAKEDRLGPVQEKVLRLVRDKPGTEVLLKPNEGRAARRLARRGLISVFADGCGVWAKLIGGSEVAHGG